MEDAEARGGITPAESVNSDLDSAYEGDIQSETTSLSSSIAAHRFENGRRYHSYQGVANTEYWAPNDEDQNDQLDIAHHIFNLIMDGNLYYAPLNKESTHDVLDLGTGTGIWAIDFADENPQAQVIGVDLSPTQPNWVPPNCSFQIDDITESWTFAENSLDFIHIRALYGSIKDWPALYERCMRHLKPGGWLEQVEYSADWLTDDDSIPEGHIFRKASASYIEAGEKMGRTFRIWDLAKDFFDKAGFVNTVEKRFKMPLGPWPADKKMKEIGRWHLLEAYQGLEGWTLALYTRILGWSVDEVQVFLAQVRQGFADRRIHAYTRGSIVYGQKPLDIPATTAATAATATAT